MGPEGLTSPRDSLQFSNKTPTAPDGYDDYEKFQENALLWEVMTSVPLEKRTSTLIGQLT